eukprot:COSAG02_NODE_11692_length_1672_cov_22.301335_1_plen_119_part_00
MAPLLSEAADADASVDKVRAAAPLCRLLRRHGRVIHSAAADLSDAAQCLATLTQHTRPVNCVRWAASSQRLASASDDNLALVWVLKPRDTNRQFGNLEEKQVENWRLFGRLQGHSHGT